METQAPNGTVITDIYEDSTTQERFTNFLTVLHKNMHNDDIIVMDNMKPHHAKSVIEATQND